VDTPTPRRVVPGLTVVPNLASGSRVRLAGRLGSHVVVYDASGREVLRQRLTAGNGTALLDISRLSAGVYVLRSGPGGRSSRGRFLVQH